MKSVAKFLIHYYSEAKMEDYWHELLSISDKQAEIEGKTHAYFIGFSVKELILRD